MTATLIAVFAALFVERVLFGLQPYRRHLWFRRYFQWVTLQVGPENPSGAWIAVLGTLLPPVAVVTLLIGALERPAHPVLHFALSAALLLLALGPRNLEQQVERYVETAQENDAEAMRTAAGELIGPGTPAADPQRHHLVIQAMVVQSHRRLFAALFWFLAAGAPGALAYRWLTLLHEEANTPETPDTAVLQVTGRVLWLAEWVPVRVMTLSLALLGSYEDTVTQWRAYRDRHLQTEYPGHDELLAAAGCAALRLPAGADGGATLDDVRAGLRLIHRVQVAVLGLLALMIVAVWTH